MSRIELKNDQYEIAYGIDHVMGMFIQVFDLSRKGEESEEPAVDLDYESDPDLDIARIVQIAEDYGFDISAELNNASVNYEG